ncbi:acyltransferase [Paenibacillus athensensis]|uniref:Acyltransferase 3 domain-containing protein n=1 Tax=Paenibacillus athensensis TaxID=1967502 RepID=A0A4Y8PTS9_9BACL|nr:acyltransferase [Paenibacillus athensensis]MCD1258609.1 acyltransferase [Paenibacillus athensensis]
MANRNDKHPLHVDSMDGLRGLAILLVMLFHVWELSWLHHGFPLFGYAVNLDFIPIAGTLGVELFFFISAFCLFAPAVNAHLEGKPQKPLRHYVYRRAIKILPSYWLMMLVMLLLVPHDFPAGQGFKHIATHLLFVHNWFHDTKNSIVGVFWSLGVEVQFYVLFPLAAWAFLRKPLLTYAGLCLIAAGYRYGVERYKFDDLLFYLNELPGYLDVFANGMLAAYALVWAVKKLPHLRRLQAWMTAAAALAAVVLLYMFQWLYDIRYDVNGVAVWQSHNRFFLGVLLTVIALGSHFAWKRWTGIVANPFFVFLSVISYNLYLWHQWIARELVKLGFPASRIADPHQDTVWQLSFTALSLGTAIAVAALITYAFERPLLKYGVRGALIKLGQKTGRWRGGGVQQPKPGAREV